MAPEPFVRAVAAAGYAGIDLVPPAYWPLVADHGLAITAVEGHASIELGLNRADQHDRIEQELRARLALAEKWRIPNLVCFSGSRADQSEADALAHTAAGLARVAPTAEAAGVTLVLELLNSKVDHPGYQADHTAWGLEVCRRVASPRVKLLYDLYHMQIMEGDLIRTLRAAHAQIGHYHTAGNPGRNDLDDTQEINYPAVLRAIAATGYAGYLAHEFVPKGDPVLALQATFALGGAYL
jgi:hydroxypyruvate isomerase